MFLWVDLFLVLPFVITMAQTAAAPRLTRLRPQGRLVSPSVLASVIGQVLLVIVFQILTAEATQSMVDFQCDQLCRPFSHSANAALQMPNTTLPDPSADTMLARCAMHYVEGVAQDSANASQDLSSGLCWNGTEPKAPCCLKQPLGCPTHAVHPAQR
jgi:hypothetical protein